MALTLVKTEEGPLLKFVTEEVHEERKGSVAGPKEVHCYAKITITNEKLEDLSQPTVYEIFVTQEEFHTDLRIKSAEQDKLVTSHSTDPEWNPEGYSKNLPDV